MNELSTAYLTADKSKAARFNGESHAAPHAALGFLPERMERTERWSSDGWGLRNANGDWIKDMKAWHAHDPRAVQGVK